MNKRQRKKERKKRLREQLQLAGMRVFESWGPSALGPLVGDILFMEQLKAAYMEVLKAFVMEPPRRREMVLIEYVQHGEQHGGLSP